MNELDETSKPLYEIINNLSPKEIINLKSTNKKMSRLIYLVIQDKLKHYLLSENFNPIHLNRFIEFNETFKKSKLYFQFLIEFIYKLTKDEKRNFIIEITKYHRDSARKYIAYVRNFIVDSDNIYMPTVINEKIRKTVKGMLKVLINDKEYDEDYNSEDDEDLIADPFILYEEFTQWFIFEFYHDNPINVPIERAIDVLMSDLRKYIRAWYADGIYFEYRIRTFIYDLNFSDHKNSKLSVKDTINNLIEDQVY